MHWHGRGAGAARTASARRALVDPGMRPGTPGGQRFAAFGQAYDVVARVEHGVVQPRFRGRGKVRPATGLGAMAKGPDRSGTLHITTA
jgi:hypothetical protein